jgi:hypothetical protein
MASELHGKYLIVSKPNYRSDEKLWYPHCAVTWQDENGNHFREFNNANTTFKTRDPAVVFGLTVGRAWIAAKL